MVGLGAERLPDLAFVLIARDDGMDTGGIARRNGLDGDIVLHKIFLSQPFFGCVQKQQLLRGLRGLGLQLAAAGGEEGRERLRVPAELRHPAHIGKREAHIPQGGDPADGLQLVLSVIAVV